MKWNHRVRTQIITKIWHVAIILSITTGLHSCNSNNQANSQNNPNQAYVHHDTIRNLVNWNVLFDSGSTYAYRTAYMDSTLNSLLIYVDNINKANHRNDSLHIRYVFCPCDSLLYNIVGDLYGATGSLATTPTKPKPTGPSGDRILFISKNDSVQVNN